MGRFNSPQAGQSADLPIVGGGSAGFAAIVEQKDESEIAAMFHPYLTQAEGIKLRARAFSKDVQ
jgi:hypothetical protein